MENLKKIITFKNNTTKGEFQVVVFGAPNYHFAIKISNSRFGHMPAGVAYCETAEHVKICLKFCKEKVVPFRIRSGGHHHEGMSSASDALIIDLSKMYGTKIDYDTNPTHAWIPSGMKLQVVYNELAKRGKVIPGGGCQSVNIGGITLGGGWGPHIRKYGLTCDSLLEVEMVRIDGTILNTSNLADKERKEILWALRGGGGGNFGVVTKFKFALSEITDVQSSFTIHWDGEENEIKKVLKCWVAMHRSEFSHNLSCSASMSVTPLKKDKHESKVVARVSGRFYGKKEELLRILKTNFSDSLPLDHGEPLMEKDVSNENKYFTFWNQNPEEDPKPNYSSKSNSNISENLVLSAAAENQFLTDFLSGEDNVNLFMGSQVVKTEADVCDLYTVLPNAPLITCDAPHPHKITSTYPIKEASDDELIDIIYKRLDAEKYSLDVRKYMVWHCLGGKMTEKELKDKSSFAYRHKPYMLQLQCWWNNSGHFDSDEGRAKEYVEWVDDFRILLKDKNLIEGAFINFVDKEVDIKEYYGENFDKLAVIKKKYDPNNLFGFEMGILGEKEEPKS